MSYPIEADTIGELLRKAAAEFGDAEAVVGSGRRFTFRQLDQCSREIARRLLARGITKGAHVGVSFGNNPQFVLSLLAVSRIGAIAVPVSTFAPGRELLRLIRYGDLAGLLTTRQVVGVDQVERLTTAIPGLAECVRPLLALPAAPALRWIEFADTETGVPSWVTEPDDSGTAESVSDALLDAVEEDVFATDVALMIHTSGTTADPKGVPHLHDTVCFRSRYLAERMQYRAGERTYTSQVLFWIGGLTMSFFTNIAAGGSSVWCERFEAAEVLSLIETERVTRLVIYPHQVEQLLAHPDFATTDRTSLRISDPRLSPDGSAHGILTPEGHRMALGMSETFGPYSWGSGGTGVIAPIQDVQPGLAVRVVDQDNQPVADGETGEIVLRGRGVTPSYYKRPGGYGFDAYGWFHTGDRGRVDGESIHFLGRMTEMIKTSGANVAPAEVIEALLAIEGIREAYVLPLPDPLRGELVSAAVVLDDGCPLDDTAIRAELRKDLSPYKVPTSIAVFSSGEIPWTPTFKVRRHQLTAMILERCPMSP
jgi:acyl-CoA synthetase (AMP-forming)/AMP-acid ligase II